MPEEATLMEVRSEVYPLVELHADKELEFGIETQILTSDEAQRLVHDDIRLTKWFKIKGIQGNLHIDFRLEKHDLEFDDPRQPETLDIIDYYIPWESGSIKTDKDVSRIKDRYVTNGNGLLITGSCFNDLDPDKLSAPVFHYRFGANAVHTESISAVGDWDIGWPKPERPIKKEWYDATLISRQIPDTGRNAVVYIPRDPNLLTNIFITPTRELVTYPKLYKDTIVSK